MVGLRWAAIAQERPAFRVDGYGCGTDHEPTRCDVEGGLARMTDEPCGERFGGNDMAVEHAEQRLPTDTRHPPDQGGRFVLASASRYGRARGWETAREGRRSDFGLTARNPGVEPLHGDARRRHARLPRRLRALPFLRARLNAPTTAPLSASAAPNAWSSATPKLEAPYRSGRRRAPRLQRACRTRRLPHRPRAATATARRSRFLPQLRLA